MPRPIAWLCLDCEKFFCDMCMESILMDHGIKAVCCPACRSVSLHDVGPQDDSDSWMALLRWRRRQPDVQAPRSKADEKISKFLSFVLRHKPGEIGLTLDANGWADVSELIEKANQSGTKLDLATIQRVVAENEKQRFAFSDDGRRIRASQGHSVEVELALQPTAPPGVLFHGTATRFLDSIRRDGLKSMGRQHVHLSPDEVTATAVGARHGKPVVLRVRSGAMADAGVLFYLSENGVWLTESVPAHFLEIPEV